VRIPLYVEKTFQEIDAQLQWLILLLREYLFFELALERVVVEGPDTTISGCNVTYDLNKCLASKCQQKVGCRYVRQLT
jgi:hypothetical protein